MTCATRFLMTSGSVPCGAGSKRSGVEKLFSVPISTLESITAEPPFREFVGEGPGASWTF